MRAEIGGVLDLGLKLIKKIKKTFAGLQKQRRRDNSDEEQVEFHLLAQWKQF